jgi:hypothetical protein
VQEKNKPPVSDHPDNMLSAIDFLPLLKNQETVKICLNMQNRSNIVKGGKDCL